MLLTPAQPPIKIIMAAALPSRIWGRRQEPVAAEQEQL